MTDLPFSGGFAGYILGTNSARIIRVLVSQLEKDAVLALPMSKSADQSSPEILSVIVAMSPVFYDTLSGVPGINTADALNPHYLKFIPYEFCIGERSFLKLVMS